MGTLYQATLELAGSLLEHPKRQGPVRMGFLRLLLALRAFPCLKSACRLLCPDAARGGVSRRRSTVDRTPDGTQDPRCLVHAGIGVHNRPGDSAANLSKAARLAANPGKSSKLGRLAIPGWFAIPQVVAAPALVKGMPNRPIDIASPFWCVTSRNLAVRFQSCLQIAALARKDTFGGPTARPVMMEKRTANSSHEIDVCLFWTVVKHSLQAIVHLTCCMAHTKGSAHARWHFNSVFFPPGMSSAALPRLTLSRTSVMETFFLKEHVHLAEKWSAVT